MLYLSKLLQLCKIIGSGLLGMFLCVLYGIGWIFTVVILIPLIGLLFLPFFVLVLCASFTLMEKGLAEVDRDV